MMILLHYMYVQIWDPVTPMITVLEIVTFAIIQQKLAYCIKDLRMYWTDLHQIFSVARLVHIWVGIINLTFFLSSP